MRFLQVDKIKGPMKQAKKEKKSICMYRGMGGISHDVVRMCMYVCVVHRTVCMTHFEKERFKDVCHVMS